MDDIKSSRPFKFFVTSTRLIRKYFVLTTLLSSSVSIFSQEARELRLGHFPNITHAQAVMAHGSGEFEKVVGVPIRWTTFNTGPAAIEALVSGAIDATYIGPSPAISAYIKSDGEALRIVAGSASGGAALVVQGDDSIKSEKDFNDKVIATPQLGNTQDVAARVWFKAKGYQLREKGGRLSIVPLTNPDQLLLFRQKEIHGAWTIEPWVSRLEIEAKGRIFLEEKSLWPQGRYVTTHLIVGQKFLEQNRGLVKKLVQAHVEITQKLNADKPGALKIINEELKKEIGKPLPENILLSAIGRVEFTWDPIRESLFKAAQDAHQIGFLRDPPSLDGIYDLSILNAVLKEKKLPSLPPKG